MKMLAKASLIVSMVIFVISLILSLMQKNIIAGPNGWLQLALTLAVLSVAIKYVHTDDNK